MIFGITRESILASNLGKTKQVVGSIASSYKVKFSSSKFELNSYEIILGFDRLKNIESQS
jgi:hypothetical protein